MFPSVKTVLVRSHLCKELGLTVAVCLSAGIYTQNQYKIWAVGAFWRISIAQLRERPWRPSPQSTSESEYRGLSPHSKTQSKTSIKFIPCLYNLLGMWRLIIRNLLTKKNQKRRRVVLETKTPDIYHLSADPNQSHAKLVKYTDSSPSTRNNTVQWFRAGSWKNRIWEGGDIIVNDNWYSRDWT